MLLTVLSVPDCPNVAVMLDRLREVLGDRAAEVDVVVVVDDERARAWGMAGSPTLLVDGVDPFAAAGVEASVSCRLYRGSDCTIGGAPSVADLRGALAAGSRGAHTSGAVAAAVTRGGRGRLAPVAGGLRAVQQAALRAFADTGSPPVAGELDRVADRCGRRSDDVLRELADEDYLTLDPAGAVRAAYPFSAAATRHRARIEGGAEVWAMCAVDALGIAAMLDRAVVIDSSDPLTGEPIRLHTQPDAARAEPPETVVYLGGRPGSGPAAKTCCAEVNFFSSPHSAARWAVIHPATRGEFASLDAAATLGRAVFGGLLTDEQARPPSVPPPDPGPSPAGAGAAST